MNLLKNKQSRIPVVLAVLILISAGVYKNFKSKENSAEQNTIQVADANPQNIDTKNQVSEKKQTEQVKKLKFSSNEEIKKEYGRLETVQLWNGRKFTGAVINTEGIYTIVTVNGTYNIPLNDLKSRDIIR